MTRTSDGVRLAARTLIVSDLSLHEPVGQPAPDEPLGRDAELREIAELIARARSGNGRLVLVSGDAGVGKTSLADAVMRRAQEQGLRVAWGRCWEGGDAPAYWPWSQILRDLVKLHIRDGAIGPVDAVVTLLQRISPRAAGAEPPISSGASFRLHDDIVQLLLETAGSRPSLFVLDDVHAASESDLSLLRLLSAELSNAPLLVLATHRPLPLQARPGSSRLLTDLLRGAVHIPLDGLDSSAVADLAARVVGVRPPAAVTDALVEATGGNPFFVVEIARSLGRDGWSAMELPDARAPLPAGVRGAVRLRLEPLPDDALHLLRLAAVIGREFDLATLQAAAGVDIEGLLPALSVAVEAGVVARAPVASGRYAFAHVLYREVLYDDLPLADRTRIHATLARVMSDRHAGDEGFATTEVARHFLEGAPLVDGLVAAHWTARAAARAAAARAYPEASRWYERTLELLTGVDAPGEDILGCALQLGDAQLHAGRTLEARSTFERAADVADQLGSAQGFAMAALGRACGLGGYGYVADADPVVIDLLERALLRVGEEDSPTRARLLGRLAVELYYSDQVSRRRALADEAVAVASRLEDPATGLIASYSRLVAGHGPDDVGARLEGSRAIIAGAHAVHDDELELRGRHLRLVTLLELGDVGEAEAEIRRFAQAVRRSPRPLSHWQLAVLDAARAFTAGRFDDAEEHAHTALALGDAVLGTAARVVFGVQVCMLRWAQGRIDEILPAIRLYLEEFPGSAWAGALSFMEAQRGHVDHARTHVERLIGHDGARVARDGNWLVTLCMLTMACWELGDEQGAALLRRELSPYADQIAIANAGAASFGSVSVFLGLAASATGDLDAAERYLGAGLARNRAVGDRPLTAWALHHYVRVLRRRGLPTDLVRAAEMEHELRASAAALGMAWLTEDRADDPPAETPDAGEEAAQLVFRREGEYWVVGRPDGPARLRDSAGMRYLHRLLQEPSRELHALDLVTSNAGQRVSADGLTRGTHDTGTGPILDERAKHEYRQRLRDLQEDLQEAEDHHDLERAASCRAEIEALTTELVRAVGLGGRDRPSSSATERARISVTKAIRRAIQGIGPHLPEVADHLQRSTRTGTYCSYEPAQPRTWLL
ncbi:MAG: AAA family ATPase [Actinobacteria bacterium]|nr:AAA family ATPase [Actinomycetota bacterium]